MKEKSYEIDLLKKLTQLLTAFEREKNPLLIHERFLNDLLIYFAALANDRMDKITTEIFFRYSMLSKVLLQKIEGSKRGTLEKTLALGQLVELLLHFGLPRIHAIEAVSEWLGLSVTKVRVANETYRKEHTFPINDMILHGKYLLSPYIFTIRDLFETDKEFLSKHTKAATAFKKTASLIKNDYYEDLLNRK